MTKVTLMGVIAIDDLIDETVGKALDFFSIDNRLFKKWGRQGRWQRSKRVFIFETLDSIGPCSGKMMVLGAINGREALDKLHNTINKG